MSSQKGINLYAYVTLILLKMYFYINLFEMACIYYLATFLIVSIKQLRGSGAKVLPLPSPNFVSSDFTICVYRR